MQSNRLVFGFHLVRNCNNDMDRLFLSDMGIGQLSSLTKHAPPYERDSNLFISTIPNHQRISLHVFCILYFVFCILYYFLQSASFPNNSLVSFSCLVLPLGLGFLTLSRCYPVVPDDQLYVTSPTGETPNTEYFWCCRIHLLTSKLSPHTADSADSLDSVLAL